MTYLDAPALHEKNYKSLTLYNLHLQPGILVRCAVARQIQWLKYAENLMVKPHRNFSEPGIIKDMLSMIKCTIRYHNNWTVLWVSNANISFRL